MDVFSWGELSDADIAVQDIGEIDYVKKFFSGKYSCPELVEYFLTTPRVGRDRA